MNLDLQTLILRALARSAVERMGSLDVKVFALENASPEVARAFLQGMAAGMAMTPEELIRLTKEDGK